MFTHLHLHTEYSLLDGLGKIKEYVSRAKALGMTSLAITDHGTASGLVSFYSECKKQGIKPVLGCEFYEAPHGRTEQDNSDRYNHLVILVKNETGYKNLCRLVSRSNTEGFYYKPRIDKELLSEFHDGLICLSGCVSGRIAKDILDGNLEMAKNDALWYRSVFGDDFYLEMPQKKKLLKKTSVESSSAVPLQAEPAPVSEPDARTENSPSTEKKVLKKKVLQPATAKARSEHDDI